LKNLSLNSNESFNANTFLLELILRKGSDNKQVGGFVFAVTLVVQYYRSLIRLT